MLKDSPSLDDLIGLVETSTNGGSELDRLAAASNLSQQLAALNDQLLDHFVQQARKAGLSWAQIGQQLGVTKQGAQQRFTGVGKADDVPHQLTELVAGLEEKELSRTPAPSRGLISKIRSAFRPQKFTPAARQVIVLAQDEAIGLRHDHIGAEHLLLGLLREETGVALSTLRPLGVTLEAARLRVAERTAASEGAPPGHLPFASEARDALERAIAESSEKRHNYIGTEHILLGLLTRDNTARQVLKEFDIDLDRLTEEVARLVERL
ncbi:MAG TPA: Clp protease N-terminal domain-containing protein [Actinomycetota bacterium]|nr:Clp protease N-terminal domain-containing protein [Actinomycetota bacterium]